MCYFSKGDIVLFLEDVSLVFVFFEIVLVPVVEVYDSYILVATTGVGVLE